jgi:hypothetical protein
LKNYFGLQLTLLSRRFADAGIAPAIAYAILPLVFIGFSLFLFYKTEYAPYIYMLLALSLTTHLSERRRNVFLKTCFGDAKLKQIRIIENLLIVSPFILFLLYKQLFPLAPGLLMLAMLLALVNLRTSVSMVIPTPFYKKPFEFTIGFRNTFYIFLAAYGLTAIAISVANFNLGIFALLLTFGITLTYYSKPEHPYYVWMHAHDAKGFLFMKIRTALLYVTILAVPIIIALGIGFPEHILILLGFIALGIAYLISMIVSKYAAYPDELNLPQGLLLALCIWLPPMLLIIIPLLFRKSTRRLSHLLP